MIYQWSFCLAPLKILAKFGSTSRDSRTSRGRSTHPSSGVTIAAQLGLPLGVYCQTITFRANLIDGLDLSQKKALAKGKLR